MSSEGLAKAEAVAAKKDNQQPLGPTSVSCPKDQNKPLHRIEVLVVGEDDKPLGDIAVVVRNPSGEELKKITDDSGVCVFSGLENSPYQLSLAELDQDAWEELKQENLPNPIGQDAPGNWQPSTQEQPAKALTHTIIQGECVSKIADRYGFFPKTIWHYPDNAELRELRHDNLYILNPGDKVVVPAKRVKSVAVSAGEKVTLRRKGVPERLRIRFLRYDESPRVGVPYLVGVKTLGGDVIPMKEGDTDEGGFVDQPVPPKAVNATIILNSGLSPEIHEFNIGYTDPIDTVSGWQARLNNLGYDCGKEDDVLGPKTRNAIRAFQQARKLEENGDMDLSTKADLLGLTTS